VTTIPGIVREFQETLHTVCLCFRYSVNTFVLPCLYVMSHYSMRDHTASCDIKHTQVCFNKVTAKNVETSWNIPILRSWYFRAIFTTVLKLELILCSRRGCTFYNVHSVANWLAHFPMEVNILKVYDI